MITNGEEILNGYFDWLCDLVCDQKILLGRSYSEVLLSLNNYEFTYTNASDENRYIDGVALRDDYIREFCFDGFEFDEPCSLLEMMIALAIRIDRSVYGEPDEYNAPRWFWVMVDSLGLWEYDDGHFSPETVDEILMDFQKSGQNLFPNPVFKNRDENEKQDLWSQMLGYLSTVAGLV